MLKQALDPANTSKCPTSPANRLDLATAGDAGKLNLIDTNGWNLDGQMPAADWADYSCKVLITSSAGLSATQGYVYVIPEQFGFNRWVKVIVQPPDAYNDFNYRDQTSDPT